MKKIIVFVLMLFMFSIDVEASVSDPFVQTINTVSFANDAYTVIVPRDLNKRINSYAFQNDGTFDYMSYDDVDLTLTGAQVQYGDIKTYFDTALYDDYEFSGYLVFNDLLKISEDTTFMYGELNYAFEWYYTFSEPSYVIVSVQNNGWYQVATVPVGSIYFSIVYGDITSYSVDNYVAYYDINGNAIPNTSAWFGSNTTDNRVGFAFLPVSALDYNNGYLDGLKIGYDNGYIDGQLIGENVGYEQAKAEYGINNSGNWLTAEQWGDIRYYEGLDQDMFGNLFDVFKTMVVMSIGMVLDTTIFPGVTIGLLFFIPIAFAVFKWFIKKV